MNQPLNVVIVVEDTNVAKYRSEIVKELQKGNFCEIVGIVKGEKTVSAKTSVLYNAFEKVDAKLFGRGTKYLGIETIEGEIVSSDSIEKGVDVVVNLTDQPFDAIKATYGIWQYTFSSYPVGYWEVVEDDPYTQVDLVAHGGTFGSKLIESFKTMTDRKSMRKNRDLVLWRSHMLMVRNLRRLVANRDFLHKRPNSVIFDHATTGVSKKPFDLQFSFSDDKRVSPPTNCQMIRVAYRLAKKYLTFTLRKFFPMDRWIILYAPTKEGEIDTKLANYKRYEAPINYFIADPFVVDEAEKSFLFFEELDYATTKGYLKVAEYDENRGEFKEAQMVMEQPYHLSYPNVFKVDGKYYMIPESFENKTVDLFEAVEFPTKWEKKKTLLDGVSAVDATLYQKEDKWWMFVNIAEKEDFSMNDELYLFSSDDLLNGEWKPHPMNPVVSDTTTARPAGNLIQRDGKLFRPAQDCSGLYGRKVVINEVLRLDEEGYEERIAGEFSSDFSDDLVAVHTLNSSERLTVIDAIKSR